MVSQAHQYLNKKAAESFPTAAFCYVPGAGLEPARGCPHKILSLACLPIPPPGRALSLFQKNRARNGIRTRDPDLGKVVLYQLSYSRNWDANINNPTY